MGRYSYSWDGRVAQFPNDLPGEPADWSSLVHGLVASIPGPEAAENQAIVLSASLSEQREGRSGTRVFELTLTPAAKSEPLCSYVVKCYGRQRVEVAARVRGYSKLLAHQNFRDYLACEVLEGIGTEWMVVYRHADDSTPSSSRSLDQYVVDVIQNGEGETLSTRIGEMCRAIAGIYQGIPHDSLPDPARNFLRYVEDCLPPALLLDARQTGALGRSITWDKETGFTILDNKGGAPRRKIDDTDLATLERVAESAEDARFWRLKNLRVVGLERTPDPSARLLVLRISEYGREGQIWIRCDASALNDHDHLVGTDTSLILPLPEPGLASVPRTALEGLGYEADSLLLPSKSLLDRAADLLRQASGTDAMQHTDLHAGNIRAARDMLKVVDVGDMGPAFALADQARLETSMWWLIPGALGIGADDALMILQGIDSGADQFPPADLNAAHAAAWFKVVAAIRRGFGTGPVSQRATEATRLLSYAAEISAYQRYSLADLSRPTQAFNAYSAYWRTRLYDRPRPSAAPELPPPGDRPTLGHLWSAAIRTGKGALTSHQQRLWVTVMENDTRKNKPLTGLQRVVWDHISNGTNPFTSQRHVLLAGPTGCGKSTVAEMFLLGTPVVNRNRAKAIYVAPTRALARAKYYELRSLINSDPLADDTLLSTGEDTSDDGRIIQGDFAIACLVYEKANVILSRNRDVLKEIGLCVVDEMHMIADEERGPGLELLLAKLLEQRQNSDATVAAEGDLYSLRVIGITTEDGSDPTIDSLFTYFDRQTEAEVGPLPLVSNERPVDIEYALVLPSTGRRSGSYETFPVLKLEKDRPRHLTDQERAAKAAELNAIWEKLEADGWKEDYREEEFSNRLLLLLENEYLGVPRKPMPLGRRFMVFVPTKIYAEKLAAAFKRDTAIANAFGTKGPPPELLNALDDSEDPDDARTIRRMAESGIFLHHSDIDHKVRRAIEIICNKPLDGEPSQVLFCTETLSFGVNLAITDVYMMGTGFYASNRREPQKGPQIEPLSACNFHNMAGRAGRLTRSEGTATFRLIVPTALKWAKQAPTTDILERYFKAGSAVKSQLFIDSDKPYTPKQKKLITSGRTEQYLADTARATVDKFTMPFVRVVLDVLRHCGIENDIRASDIVDFIEGFSLYSRQRLEVNAGNPNLNPSNERRQFQQAVIDVLDSCSVAPLQLTVRHPPLAPSVAGSASGGGEPQYSITDRGEAVIETGTAIGSVISLIRLREELRNAWREFDPHNPLPAELYLLAFVAIDEVSTRFRRYTVETRVTEQGKSHRLTDAEVELNRQRVLGLCQKALELAGFSHADRLAELCRGVLERMAEVKKMAADYPGGGVECVLRGFTAMLLWISGAKKQRVLRHINWEDPDAAPDSGKLRGTPVTGFPQTCDVIAWRAVFLHRMLTKEDRKEVNRDEQRGLLHLAQRIRLGCRAAAIPLFWPNGSRLRRDEAEELVRNGHTPARILATKEPGVLDKVRTDRLDQLKADLRRFAERQAHCLSETLRRRLRGQEDQVSKSLFDLWGSVVQLIRQAAADYWELSFVMARIRGATESGRVDAGETFRESFRSPSQGAGDSPERPGGQLPFTVLSASDGMIELRGNQDGSSAPRRFMLLPLRLLSDWQVVDTRSLRTSTFESIVEKLRGFTGRPLLVAFPWLPSVEKLPRAASELLARRVHEGLPSMKVVTPAALLSALTLIHREFMPSGPFVDLIDSERHGNMSRIGVRDIVDLCDEHAHAAYWDVPQLREAMLQHFEVDR